MKQVVNSFMGIRGGHTLVKYFYVLEPQFYYVKCKYKQLLFYWSCPKNRVLLDTNGLFLLNKLVKEI